MNVETTRYSSNHTDSGRRVVLSQSNSYKYVVADAGGTELAAGNRNRITLAVLEGCHERDTRRAGGVHSGEEQA